MADLIPGNAVIGQSGGPTAVINESLVGVVEGLRVEGVEQVRVALVPDAWSPAKCLAYLAADNELARGSHADAVALEALVQEVALSDRDLA